MLLLIIRYQIERQSFNFRPPKAEFLIGLSPGWSEQSVYKLVVWLL